MCVYRVYRSLALRALARDLAFSLDVYMYVCIVPRSLAASLARDLALSLFLCVFPRLSLVELSRSLSRFKVSCALSPLLSRAYLAPLLWLTRALFLSPFIPPLHLRARALSLDLSPRVTFHTTLSPAPTLKRGLPFHTHTQNLGCQELKKSVNVHLFIFV